MHREFFGFQKPRALENFRPLFCKEKLRLSSLGEDYRFREAKLRRCLPQRGFDPQVSRFRGAKLRRACRKGKVAKIKCEAFFLKWCGRRDSNSHTHKEKLRLSSLGEDYRFREAKLRRCLPQRGFDPQVSRFRGAKLRRACRKGKVAKIKCEAFFLKWCGRRDSNSHTHKVLEPKSNASANSATPARNKW